MRRYVLLLLVAGCASHGSSSDASPSAVDLACESQGTTFPKLEKACSVASNCFIAEHMISCCGTMVAIGFNVSSRTAFTSAETTCADAYPGCGCAAFPTKAEDNRTTIDGAIAVGCDTGTCRTFVP